MITFSHRNLMMIGMIITIGFQNYIIRSLEKKVDRINAELGRLREC